MMSKEDIKNCFRFKNVNRAPFMPLICSFAAKLEQISTKTLLTNPTKMANCLQKAQQLLGYDAIFNIVDPTLEAEACGCEISWDVECEMPRVISHPLEDGIMVDQLPLSDIENRGRIPVVLEATKRLQIVMGNKVDIIGALTGPLTLSQHLVGETFNKNLNDDFSEVHGIIRYANTICTRLCKSYCERKVDGILIYDTLISKLNSETLKLVRPFYRTLFNVVNYFNIYFMIFVGSPPAEAIENIFEFDANGFIVSGVADIDNIAQLAARKNKLLGYGISNSTLLGSTDLLRETVKNLMPKTSRGFFLSTEGEAPYTTPTGNMYELINIVLLTLK